MAKSNSLPPAGHYTANYGNCQTELYAQIHCEAFAEDIGQNSWLTADEQDRFLEWLDRRKPYGLAQYKAKVGNSLESQDLR